MEKLFNKEDLVKVFNEWMRRYIESPEEFSREFESINLFLSEEGRDEKPSYGETCFQYILKLNEELQGETK